MIHFYRLTPGGLENVKTLPTGAWVRVQTPSQEDLSYIRDTFTIPPRFITHALDLDELARHETSGDIELIVLRIPWHENKSAHESHKTIALSILVTPQHIITICQHATAMLDRVAAIGKEDTELLRPTRFILHTLLLTAEDYLHQLATLKKALDVTEDRLRVSQQNRELFELLRLQKSLVYFTTGLNSNELMLQQLHGSDAVELTTADHELLNCVVIETRQALEITTITEGILSQMMDAFASIISNNLNVVMKFLAAITIVLSFPTIVASIYGMNVTLPMQSSPAAFYILIFISLVVSVLVGFVFWQRRWM